MQWVLLAPICASVGERPALAGWYVARASLVAHFGDTSTGDCKLRRDSCAPLTSRLMPAARLCMAEDCLDAGDSENHRVRRIKLP